MSKYKIIKRGKIDIGEIKSLDEANRITKLLNAFEPVAAGKEQEFMDLVTGLECYKPVSINQTCPDCNGGGLILKPRDNLTECKRCGLSGCIITKDCFNDCGECQICRLKNLLEPKAIEKARNMLNEQNGNKEYKKQEKRPIEDILVELASEVPDEEWDKLPSDLTDNPEERS